MATYRPNPEVVSTQLNEEESVLLNLETQRYFTLNETGSRIWDLLSDGHDAEAIASAVEEEWAISDEEALKHVRSFLQELSDEGLVESVNES